MTHVPKNAEDLEAMAQHKLSEMLKNMKSITSMYVEPGDTVIIEVNKSVDIEDMEDMAKGAKEMFPNNKVILSYEDIIKDIKVIKDEA